MCMVSCLLVFSLDWRQAQGSIGSTDRENVFSDAILYIMTKNARGISGGGAVNGAEPSSKSKHH
jgi:hypothetical protein